MRPLLVLTATPLPEALREALEHCHWAPVPVGGLEEAVAAAAGHDVYVGLALFPADDAPERARAWVRTIQALPGLRWVATMTRQQAEAPLVRQLIVERLYDYQVEPVEPLRLCHALGHAHGIAQIEQDLRRQAPDPLAGRHGMVGTSEVMRALYEAIDRVAASDASLLIVGPTGSGKELVASAIHGGSARATGPLVSLNCAAIPPALIQSELFGHRRGAFTGAIESTPGLIETAAGGTLFLDEIGEMPLESQSSLLRFLDNRRVHALGDDRSVEVDVRIIAATNRDLEQEASRNRFRADLFYRLSVLTLRAPALKDRGADVERLAEHFLREAQQRFGAVPIGFSQTAQAALRRHGWPGNVRELRSRVYQAAIQCDGRYIEPVQLGFAQHIDVQVAAAETRSLNEIRNQAERDAIEAALLRNAYQVRQAAADLQVSRMTLYRLMEKHGLGAASGDEG